MPSHTINRVLATLQAKRNSVQQRAGVRMCMTAEEIAAEIGVSKSAVIAAIHRHRKRFTGARKRIYIAKWQRQVGVSGDAAAMWGLGNYPDVKPPKNDPRAAEARYRARHRETINARARMKYRTGKGQSAAPINHWLRTLTGK